MLSNRMKIFTTVILIIGSLGVINTNMLLLVLSMLLIGICMTWEVFELYRMTENDMDIR